MRPRSLSPAARVRAILRELRAEPVVYLLAVLLIGWLVGDFFGLTR